MSATGKVYPGQFLQPLPAWIQNELVDMALENRRRRNGAASPATDMPTDRVILKNNSGGALAAGRVLEIGTKLITTLDRDHLWFNGETPAPDGADVFAITTQQSPSSALCPCYVAGVVLCRLNVNHVQHAWADVDNSSTLLQSKWHGRAKIIWKSTASTGEQDALVELGHDFRGPINVVCTSGITAGSSASCAVYWAGSAASPSATITCYLNWMDGGTDAASNAEAQVFWHPDQQKYIVSSLEC